MATAGDVIYYEYQSSGIAAARKATNKAIMDMQEDITHFQEQFNGPFPFNANGIVIALPNASFQEEMQTKIVFVNGSIGNTAEIFSHENMHQWWGDSVSYQEPRYTFFKEGYADASQYLFLADVAGKAAGPVGSAAYNTAFEASIASRFAATNRYNTTSTSFWTVVPTNPTSGQLFGSSNTYNRPGQSYIALRAILGNDQWVKVNREIQTDYKYGSITPEQVIAVYHKYLPNQSIGCHNKLDAFFKQWWFTSYSGTRRSATSRPSRARAWPATTTSMTPMAAARITASTFRSRSAAPLERRSACRSARPPASAGSRPASRRTTRRRRARTSSRPRATRRCR